MFRRNKGSSKELPTEVSQIWEAGYYTFMQFVLKETC